MNRKSCAVLALLAASWPAPGFARQAASVTAAAIDQSLLQPVPNLAPVEGTIPGHGGVSLTLRFAVFASKDDRDPLWSEEQTVETGPRGEYSVLLGAGSANGLPPDLFAAGEPRWLAVSAGDAEQPRTLLASVPYALKAADADTLAGHSASSFVTQAQLAERLRAAAASLAAQAAQPLVAGTVTGAGTANLLPLWTSASVLGNSPIAVLGSNVGIATTGPAATLDVNGVEVVRGELKLKGNAAPTAAAGVDSPQLYLAASSYSSTAKAPVRQSFVWQALSAGNNTASPSGNLALLYAAGATAVPKPTGFSIAPTGLLTFAPGQTFPGAGKGTITGVTAGTGLTGGGASGSVKLAIDPNAIPQLSAYNTFASGASFGGATTIAGSSTGWMLFVNSTSATSKGAIAGQASAFGTGVEGASPSGLGVEGVSDAGYGLYGMANTSGIAVYGGALGTGTAGSFWSQNPAGPAVVVNSVAGGTGISSTSKLGIAISGVSTTQPAVFASSTTGSAVNAAASTGSAGNFSNIATFNPTISATNGGAGNAGVFNNNSASHVALAGINLSTDNGAIATYGSVSSGKAVYGIAATGIGVYGTSGGGSGSTGVAGVSTGSGNGVFGYSPSGIGVYAASSSDTSGVALYASGGVYGVEALSADGTAVLGHSTNNYGGFFQTDSSDVFALVAYNSASGTTHTLFNVLKASSPEGACGVGGAGELSCTGRVKTLVSVGGGARKVETYSVQSPESWMEDFGSGEIRRGVALVKIDPAFAETVTPDASYHVFITPRGDSKGLYVINATPTSFEVRESGGGTSSLAFDFRIVAKRRGYEAQRLTDVTERYNAEAAPVERPVHSGAPHGPVVPAHP
jgi:hypothetical protein